MTGNLIYSFPSQMAKARGAWNSLLPSDICSLDYMKLVRSSQSSFYLTSAHITCGTHWLSYLAVLVVVWIGMVVWISKVWIGMARKVSNSFSSLSTPWHRAFKRQHGSRQEHSVEPYISTDYVVSDLWIIKTFHSPGLSVWCLSPGPHSPKSPIYLETCAIHSRLESNPIYL